MTTLNQIISVSISKETQAVSQAGFGVALIVGPNASGVFGAGEVVRSYTSPADMITDGFGLTDKEYLMALSLMSQSKKPSSFMVGVHDAPTSDNLEITYVGTLTSGSVAVKVNGTTYTQAFDTDQDTTMSALAVLIAADTLVASCSWDDIGQVLTIVGSAGEGINYGGVSSLGDFTSSSEAFDPQTSTIATELALIDQANDDWYALLLASSAYDDIIAAAAAIEAQNRIFGFDEISEVALVTGEALSALYKVNSLNYEHTSSIYNPTRTEYKFAAWFGEVLPQQPGSVNWAYKTLAGVSSYKLTSTQETELDGKNGNRYMKVGGVDITQFGYMANGQYLDIIRGEHWLVARIQEAVYSTLVNSPKVPYTEPGFVIIQNNVFSVLNQGVANGYLVDDTTKRVEVPALADISTTDKANRHLPNVKFYANLAGAVNTVAIEGTLTLA